MSHQFWKTITPVVGEKIPDGAEYKTDLGWARSMTPKELRKAAELSATECFQYFEEYHEEDHDDPDSKQHYERIDMMAAHILATVREDDVELIDVNWLESLVRTDGELSMITVRLCEDRKFHLVCNGYVQKNPSTRGDFHQLCRLLGVQLKERS